MLPAGGGGPSVSVGGGLMLAHALSAGGAGPSVSVGCWHTRCMMQEEEG